MLAWSTNFLISASAGAARFAITDTKFYVPLVTVPIWDRFQLLQ